MVANGWRVKNTNIYFSPITISTSFVDDIICIHHDKIQSYPKCTKQFHFISFHLILMNNLNVGVKKRLEMQSRIVGDQSPQLQFSFKCNELARTQKQRFVSRLHIKSIFFFLITISTFFFPLFQRVRFKNIRKKERFIWTSTTSILAVIYWNTFQYY